MFREVCTLDEEFAGWMKDRKIAFCLRSRLGNSDKKNQVEQLRN